MIKGEPVIVNGSGETSRGFCYIENVVLANILAASTDNPAAVNQAYNIALNDRTTLNQLFENTRELLAVDCAHLADLSRSIMIFALAMSCSLRLTSARHCN